jgi:hypothetical protein
MVWFESYFIPSSMNASKLNSSKGLGMMVVVERTWKDRLLSMNLFHKRNLNMVVLQCVSGESGKGQAAFPTTY